LKNQYSFIMMIPEEDIIKIKILQNVFLDVAKSLKKGKSESVYKKAILCELQKLNIRVSEEEISPIIYKEEVVVGSGRIDLMLYSWFPSIIELKAVYFGIKVEYIWQILGYMETKQLSYGFVVNFNTTPNKPLNIQTVIVINQEAYLYDIETNAFEKVPSSSF
jgi:GxxExxY protein